MKSRQFAMVAVALVTIFVAGTLPADSQMRRGSQLRATPQAMHGTAVAALEPVGEATGWGRIVVRDADLPSGHKRFVQVWLYGLEPRAEYVIEIDEVEIGTVRTRSSGSGFLKLQNDGRGHQSVSDLLLPAAELVSAVVLLDGAETTLQGDFSSMGGPGKETTCEEEIVLIDVTLGDATGMAKIEMQGEEYQEFKTHAAGLEPASTYKVFVNGIEITTLTAGPEGQARLHLEYPDDENPIPLQLLPVSDIETVQWYAPGDVLILEGAFTGRCVCTKIVGEITAVDTDEFTLETQDGPVSVVTTVDTEWEDFDGQPPAVGDHVKVEGCWDEDLFYAEKVERKDCCDEDECFKVVGVISSIDGYAYNLETEEGPFTVLTTDETEWVDFGDHLPALGDKVKAGGCLVGDDFVADVVELKRSVEKEKCFKRVGTATDISPGVSFTLVTEEGTMMVLIMDDTELENFDGPDLTEGDKVKVEGCMQGDNFVADVVELKKTGKP